ncbi:AAA family ATPase, partial [Vibrio parahaemolyticus]|nr:AAA family ATPase [Vibrio parahaemolyticus]
QRLSLAAATMHKPELLFLDEPTSAVDPENRRDFWEQLFDLCDQGTTILVTTHYMDEAERCHRLAIMESGEIRADGEPEQLMEQMGVNIIEVKTNKLRELKEKLIQCDEVRSAAQLGIRLRILIHQHVEQPIEWLKQTFPELQNAEMNYARPSLEDVFVSVTGKGRQ